MRGESMRHLKTGFGVFLLLFLWGCAEENAQSVASVDAVDVEAGGVPSTVDVEEDAITAVTLAFPEISCENIPCSGAGQCVVVDGVVQCDCDPGYTSVGLKCYPQITCGNGQLDPGEYCDPSWDDTPFSCSEQDPAFASGQGKCDTFCQLDLTDCIPHGACGNGVLEEGEQCDDGNTTHFDGCSATCKDENAEGEKDHCTDDVILYSGVEGGVDLSCYEEASAQAQVSSQVEQIRVRFHVMVSDAGDWSVEQGSLEAYFPVWNGILDKLGIQLVWDGTVLTHVDEGLFEIAGNGEVNALFGLERDPEAIDIYFVHSLLSLNQYRSHPI